MAMDCLQNHCSDCYAWVVCSCSAESKVCMTICRCILRNKIVNYIYLVSYINHLVATARRPLDAHILANT